MFKLKGRILTIFERQLVSKGHCYRLDAAFIFTSPPETFSFFSNVRPFMIFLSEDADEEEVDEQHQEPQQDEEVGCEAKKMLRL